MAFEFLTKCLRALLTFILVIIIVFAGLRLTGDPAYAVLPPDSPPDVVAAYRALWGLDKPLPDQFLLYIEGLLSGNLGHSMLDGRPVSSLVAERLPRTIELMAIGLMGGFLLGIFLGTVAALRRGSRIDRAVLTLSVLGYALPSFILSLLFILIFSVTLGWLPTGGNTSWRNLILPAVTIAVGNAGLFARYSRSALLDILPKPFLRAAIARGLSGRMVLFAHALPNAALPILTILGLSAGSIVGGAVITETVFAWHGLGDLLVTSVARRDLAVVQAIVLLLAATMIVSNLGVELLLSRLDPRIRGELRGARK